MGSVSVDAISRHRRLREFTQDDYGILIDFIAQVDRVLVTPNTLTEPSNLLRFILLLDQFRYRFVLRFLVSFVRP